MRNYFRALFTITLILGLVSTVAANACPEQSIFDESQSTRIPSATSGH